MRYFRMLFMLLCVAQLAFTVSCLDQSGSPPKARSIEGNHVASPGFVFQVCENDSIGCNTCYEADEVTIYRKGISATFTMHLIGTNSYQHVVIINPCSYRQVRIKNPKSDSSEESKDPFVIT